MVCRAAGVVVEHDEGAVRRRWPFINLYALVFRGAHESAGTGSLRESRKTKLVLLNVFKPNSQISKIISVAYYVRSMFLSASLRKRC